MKTNPSANALTPPEPQQEAAADPTLDRRDAAAIAALMAGIVAMFWKVLFTPAMLFYRDIFSYSYPHARFIHEICRQGQLPYWNPYLNYGEPVLANPNFLFFYPYTLALVVLPIEFAYTMHYVVHIALAGVGTYLLAQRWAQSRSASFVAAFVFAFSGPVLSLGNFFNHVAAAAWIPWALLLTDRALAGRSWRPWVLLTLVFALQFLASEPFTLIATFGLAVVYALWRLPRGTQLFSAARLRIIVSFMGVALLMVALAAVQFLPSLDLLRNSRRGVEGLPFNETTSWSFHPLHLLEAVIPNFFGSPLESPSLWTLVVNCRNMPYFPSIFVGFVPVFLALAGWALGSDRRRNFAVGAALTLLVLAFGRFTPVFSLAYLLVPPLALVRFPVKLLVPAVLMLALLAGWGLDALRHGGPFSAQLRKRLLLPVECLLAGAIFTWVIAWIWPEGITVPAAWILLKTNAMFVRNPAGELLPIQVTGATELFLKLLQLHLPGLAGFALGGIVWILALERGKGWARRALPVVTILGLAHLAVVNYSANPTVPRSFYTYRPPVLEHFRDSGQPHRFSYIFREADAPSATPDVQGFLNLESIPEAAQLPSIAQMAFRDRLLLARGSMLEKVEGISNIDVERSFPPFLYDFWVFALRRLPDGARLDCLLGRTNVRYQILRAQEASMARREVAPIFNGSAKPSYLYENLCLAPRAYAVSSASYTTNADETLARMASADFDPTMEVLLAGERKPVPAGNPGSAGRVEIVERTPNRVTLHAELSSSGYLALLDRFDPNWRATLDDREVPVLRANHLFRAVQVGAGHHEVRFYYRQRGLRAGLSLSLITLAILVAAFVLDPHPRRPEDSGARR